MSRYSHNAYDLFRKSVETYRERPALRWSEQETITFAALDRLAENAALFLQRNGVQKGDRVGIRLDKCTLAYALIIACLRIGAPYFFVDPSNPRARALHILDKCKPALIFSTNEPPLDLSNYLTVEVDENHSPAWLIKNEVDHALAETDVTGADAAYIMFTSGSTGFPKGAVMSHANVFNLIRWAKTEFSVTPQDVFTNVNPLFFDNSIFDFYSSVFNGASLVPFDKATLKDPYHILRRIDELHCTIYFSVPSLLVYFQTLKAVTPSSFAHVRTIIFGGEGYPKAKLKHLFDCLHERIEFVNVYGPTECTCICSSYRVSATDFEDLGGYASLGGPIPNFSFFISNPQGGKALPNEVGELYLGGPCVGLGYFGEAELTRDSFVQNPHNLHYHERLYRTGDLVSVSSKDGKVYFAGRKDSQIKHQGYRIELGEVEHSLSQVGGVDEAVALHTTRDGFSAIIAVVASTERIRAETIRKEVAKTIPDYMVPGRIEVVDRLPKNTSGKIDRRLLQERYC